MSNARVFTQMIGLVIVMLVGIGCDYAPTQPTPTSTPVPPAATPVPPTVTPTLAGPAWPSARKYGAMVYDPVTESFIMFGGLKRYSGAGDMPEVWAYDPGENNWQELGKLESGAVRGAAVDEESQRVIVFGQGGGTWAYDPAADTWQKMKPAVHPSSRWGALMAYDVESDRIVFFGGGLSPTNCYDDTWVYDYNTDT